MVTEDTLTEKKSLVFFRRCHLYELSALSLPLFWYCPCMTPKRLHFWICMINLLTMFEYLRNNCWLFMKGKMHFTKFPIFYFKECFFQSKKVNKVIVDEYPKPLLASFVQQTRFYQYRLMRSLKIDFLSILVVEYHRIFTGIIRKIFSQCSSKGLKFKLFDPWSQWEFNEKVWKRWKRGEAYK